ncbi:MAG: hypothetical protein CL569_02955 [Alphaproteobacteria bacterium]|nr:hypothetical protein [Alphaproteobacteria bacterium]|tara:strand:- start:334 stop:1074 length:741 start_codon:yes stop_codon:yes gene_type:complete
MELASVLLSPQTIATLAVGLIAGLIRGYTGFGGAIFAIPLLSLIYGPTSAVALVLAAGLVGTAQLMPGALPMATWRQIVPMVLVSLVFTPLGTWVLLTTDPDYVRRGLGLFVLVAAVTMMWGWSWQGPRTPLISGIVGAISGIVTGIGGIGGSVATLYLISSGQPVKVIRANLIIIIGALTIAGFVYLLLAGGILFDDLFKMLIYLPTYMAFIWIGARIFRGTSDALYRQVALWLLAAVGIIVTIW